MDVPHRVGEPLLDVLARKGIEEFQIFIDGARDDVEIESLRLARLLVHEELQARGIGIGEPFLDGEAVALRLRDLLALFVEEELVVEAFGRRAPSAAQICSTSFTESMRSLPDIS